MDAIVRAPSSPHRWVNVQICGAFQMGAAFSSGPSRRA
jgi:hypothetical protein